MVDDGSCLEENYKWFFWGKMTDKKLERVLELGWGTLEQYHHVVKEEDSVD